MAGITGLAFSGHLQGKSLFPIFLYGCVTLITTFHVAVLAAKFSIRNLCNLHKTALFFIPVSHPFAGGVKAFFKK